MRVRRPARSAKKRVTSSTSISGCRPSVIPGRYFDGISSAPVEATLEFGADGRVRVHGLSEPVDAPLLEVEISDRIGNIARRISFPAGGVFETHDNAAVDAALEAARDLIGLHHGSGLVNWLES